MNREIKSRAWASGKKKMYYTDFAVKPDGSTSTWGIYERLELMQYTGLKDKNGVEIYEGDILRHIRFNWKEPGHPAHRTDLTHICQVRWDEVRCAFRADGKFEGGGGFGWGFPLGDDRADKVEVEVIGNIYENKELLNGN